MFNIIARRALLAYCKEYPEAREALLEWYQQLSQSGFNNFNELEAQYGNASIVADNRVVFNVMGNKYRLVVRMVFEYKTIQIKWFGSHAEYDKTQVTTIQNPGK